jgi:hypothetical protein
MAIGRDFLNVDHRTVGYPPSLRQPVTALAFDLSGSLFLSAKYEISGECRGTAGCQKFIKANRRHIGRAPGLLSKKNMTRMKIAKVLAKLRKIILFIAGGSMAGPRPNFRREYRFGRRISDRIFQPN